MSLITALILHDLLYFLLVVELFIYLFYNAFSLVRCSKYHDTKRIFGKTLKQVRSDVHLWSIVGCRVQEGGDGEQHYRVGTSLYFGCVLHPSARKRTWGAHECKFVYCESQQGETGRGGAILVFVKGRAGWADYSALWVNRNKQLSLSQFHRGKHSCRHIYQQVI